MTYTSLKSPENRDYTYILNVAHLYGNLLNTYGDNGNVLMMKYVGEKLGAKMTFDIVSVGDDFDKELYDIVFFGGGQDYDPSLPKISRQNVTLLINTFKITKSS